MVYRDRMPRSLSVIIPSYNHARFIARAIESVAVQADEDLELVVVDDGSRDHSVEVIESALEDAGIARVQIIQQPNAGAPAAINRGIRASTGDLVAILNSDDSYAPNRFLRMRQEVPDEGDFFAFSVVNMVDTDDAPLGEHDESSLGYRHALYESSPCPTVGFALLKINFAVTSGNFFFTRSLFEKIGGFREYDLAHDWDFALRALYHVEPIFVPEKLINYRTHGHNARHGLQDRSFAEGREILNSYLSMCAKSPPLNRLAPCEENWPVYFDMFSSYHEPWFDRAPLREHLDDPPAGRPDTSTAQWRPWAAAVDFHDVRGRAYLTAGSDWRDSTEAIVVARSVAIDAPDHIIGTYGAVADAIADLVARQTGNAVDPRARIWPSPFFHATSEGRYGAPKRGLLESLGLLKAEFLADLKGYLKAMLSRASGHGDATARIRRWKDLRVIRKSGVFELSFYQSQCSGLPFANINDAIRHYATSSLGNRLNPNPFFDTRYYLDQNPDVASSGIDPLFHYIVYGEAEGRKPHPSFDPFFYREVAGESRAATEGLLCHYQRVGRKQGLPTSDAEPVERIYEGESLARSELVDSPLPAQSIKRLGVLRRSLFFDADTYRVRAEAKLGEFGDAARHLVQTGGIHGLPFLDSESLSERLWDLDVSDRSRAELEFLRPLAKAPKKTSATRVAVYTSSVGNAFHAEIARFLVHGFKTLGVKVSLLDENAETDAAATHSIVVAPHEFFELGEGFKRCTPEFLGRSHLFLAEQPGSPYFSKCLWFAYRSKGVLDVSPMVALLWGDLGIRARALPLGHLEGYDPLAQGESFDASSKWPSLSPAARSWRGGAADPLGNRPIDLFFNGVLTQRREEFFAANAKCLAAYECALFMPQPWVKVEKGSPSALSESAATEMCRRSKIQLNIHRSEMPYFEWHRNVVRSVAQQTLLVTETSYPVPGFDPGEHYFQCDLERMPAMIDWLLQSREGRERADQVRRNAFKAFRESYPMERMLQAFLSDTGEGR